jgi:hypothetical protein
MGPPPLLPHFLPTQNIALFKMVDPQHKAKEELWKLKYITMQNYNLRKIL